MSGVGILCFAASYAVALCLEISRIFFRSSIRTVFALAWLLAGLVAHTAYLYYHHAVSPVAVDGAESFFLVSAWSLILVNLYLACFHPKVPFGLVLLPIVLLLIGGAVLVPDSASNASWSLWKRLHAATFLLATLSVCVSFMAGMLYLCQDRRLRRKQPTPESIRLPTLEWSLALCRRAMGASVFLLGACIFSGVLLRSGPDGAKLISITDPLILGTLLMFGFLLLFSLNLFKAEGRNVARLTLLAFLFLIFVLTFGILVQDAHWKRSIEIGGDTDRVGEVRR